MVNTAEDGAAQVFSEVTRFSTLSVTGQPAVGAATYTTTALLKATFTPVMETGVDLVTINANGDIAQHFKHSDMPKYYTMAVEMATPDPIAHQLLAGGTLLTDSSTALATPGTITTTPATTGGVLAAATYYYVVTAANQYGQTVASAEATGVVASGTTGSVALSLTAVAGAVYYMWYGRSQGTEQFLAKTTSPAFTDTGAITPNGAIPTANTTAGPGADTGYQAPALGVVGNPQGVSIEFWGKAILNGTQAVYLPYWRWVVPLVTGMHDEARSFGPDLLENMYTGQSRENLAWGGGPFGDWQFDSTRAYQYARADRTTVPTPGYATIPATA